MDLQKMQQSIREADIAGWLFCDVYKRDRIAYHILGLDETGLFTRRWFYFVPATGEPVKLVHKIERGALQDLPGRTVEYLAWREMRRHLGAILSDSGKIAMQYSPYNNIPTISYADAGTVELIRSFGVDVVSSADLVQRFEATVDERGIALHREAGEKVQRIKDEAFGWVRDAIQSGQRITEYDVQRFILDRFEAENLTCEGAPIVAVNAHATNPHYEPTPDHASPIERDGRLLIDLWAKVKAPGAIYYDITWCGYMGEQPPDEYRRIFDIAVEARERAKRFIVGRFENSQRVFGWEVDQVARDYITEQGYGEYFIHRTGHSIHTQLHGNGVNLDSLETQDDRALLPGVCFSIEPGIYKGDLGVRSEINVLIDGEGHIIIVGPEQRELVGLS